MAFAVVRSKLSTRRASDAEPKTLRQQSTAPLSHMKIPLLPRSSHCWPAHSEAFRVSPGGLWKSAGGVQRHLPRLSASSWYALYTVGSRMAVGKLLRKTRKIPGLSESTQDQGRSGARSLLLVGYRC